MIGVKGALVNLCGHRRCRRSAGGRAAWSSTFWRTTFGFPIGVSYMLEDRRMMMRLFPELFARHKIAPVEHYPDMLFNTCAAWRPPVSTPPWSC